jgi:hypothetical protein
MMLMKIAFDSPHNAKVLAYLASGMKTEGLTSVSRGEYEKESSYYAWTHPDLSDQFWSQASALKSSQWALYQHAVLVHPESGILFGFVRGTSTLALRLPPKELEEAFGDPDYGRKVDYKPQMRASEIGDDWAFVNPFTTDPERSAAIQRWFQAAHDYAGTLK